MTHAAPLDPRVLEETANWLSRLYADTVSDEDRAACERWRRSSADHARAWERAELLMSKLGALPPRLAMRVLDRPDDSGRRQTLAKIVAVLAIAPPSIWAGKRAIDGLQWTADFRTRVGERRQIELRDRTAVTLNTDTAVDVHFTDSVRELTLRAGEILVTTAKDARSPPRPFRIVTSQGVLEALGTRFNVRLADNSTRLAVLDGAVAVESGRNAFARTVLAAGSQTSFTRNAIAEPRPTDATIAAWSTGVLIADKLPLAAVALEIGRYRAGIVRCDPEVARILVSGAFPIADTPRTLAMLEATYPVRVRSASPYWITLTAR